MKRLITFGLPFLLLLGGGGAAGWYFFMGPGSEMLEESVFNRAPDPGLIEFKPFVVSVRQGSEVTHHLTMDLALIVKDEADEEPAEALMPRLKDSILTEFHGLYSRRFVLDEGFDMPLVKERILVASNRVLGAGTVTAVELNISATRKPPNSL